MVIFTSSNNSLHFSTKPFTFKENYVSSVSNIKKFRYFDLWVIKVLLVIALIKLMWSGHPSFKNANAVLNALHFFSNFRNPLRSQLIWYNIKLKKLSFVNWNLKLIHLRKFLHWYFMIYEINFNYILFYILKFGNSNECICNIQVWLYPFLPYLYPNPSSITFS